MKNTDLDNMSCYSLCKAAGFTKNGNRYNKVRLTIFDGESEQTLDKDKILKHIRNPTIKKVG